MSVIISCTVIIHICCEVMLHKLYCWQILFFSYALNFINRCFGSLFWLLGVPIGSLFHKKLGPYWVPISKPKRSLYGPSPYNRDPLGDSDNAFRSRPLQSQCCNFPPRGLLCWVNIVYPRTRCWGEYFLLRLASVIVCRSSAG